MRLSLGKLLKSIPGPEIGVTFPYRNHEQCEEERLFMQTSQNLFVALHRWASGQDENFTIEAFAYLLRHLQTHEPSVVAKILRRLTESLIDVEPDKISTTKWHP
jgi:hypothetical protein